MPFEIILKICVVALWKLMISQNDNKWLYIYERSPPPPLSVKKKYFKFQVKQWLAMLPGFGWASVRRCKLWRYLMEDDKGISLVFPKPLWQDPGEKWTLPICLWFWSWLYRHISFGDENRMSVVGNQPRYLQRYEIYKAC